MLEIILNTLAHIPSGAVWTVLAISLTRLPQLVGKENDAAMQANLRHAATTVAVVLALGGAWIYGAGFYLAALVAAGVFFVTALLVAVVAEIGKSPRFGPGFAALHAVIDEVVATATSHWLLTSLLSLLVVISSAWLIWLLRAPWGVLAAFLVNCALINGYLGMIQRNS